MSLSFGSVQSLFLQRTLSSTSRLVGSSLEKLSTGYRINRAADDAAGLSISEQLISQIRGYEQSIRNAQDGYSMLSVAEGATSTINENLQRIRELSVQAANDTLSTAERGAISAEINQRLEDIDRISDTTKFNNIDLLNENVPAQLNLQVGPGSSDVIDISDALGDAAATALGLPSAGTVDLSTGTAARAFIDTVDSAIETLNTRRSSIGAYQNRLDSVISNLSVSSMNVSAANSRIRDTDIAAETSRLVRYQMIQQFDIQLLAQVNSMQANMTLSLIGSLQR
jgi:flagellin